MDALDDWRISEELSVLDAVALMLGIDPSSIHPKKRLANEMPPGWDPRLKALTFAIISKRIPAKIRRSAWARGWDENQAKERNSRRRADCSKIKTNFQTRRRPK